MSQQVFVGRERELAKLQMFLDNSLANQGRAIFVSGEVGSGKTALVDEFTRLAEADHVKLVVARANCNAQTGLGDPYLPFREVLSVLTGDIDAKVAQGKITNKNAERLRTIFVHAVQVLVEVGPDLIDVLVPGSKLIAMVGKVVVDKAGWTKDLEELTKHKLEESQLVSTTTTLKQNHIFEQYTKVLTTLAVQQPLMLVVEDLHWADDASISLLFHLARNIDKSRILIVGTYRPEEVALDRVGERHPLKKVLTELKRYFGDVVVNLDQATDAERREFVNALLDTEPNRLTERFRRSLYARTRGQALFTVELLKELKEGGRLLRDEKWLWIEGPDLDWIDLPARVEGIIEERIGRLDDELREILDVASVEGQHFTAQVVAHVQSTDELRLLRNLSDELDKQNRLVRELGEVQASHRFLARYEFIHTLFQQYIYGELSEGVRRLLHSKVAHALEDLYEEQIDKIIIQLAHHYSEAGEEDKAVVYLIRAGDHATQSYAYAEARLHYAKALDALANLPDSEENRRHHVDTYLKHIAVSQEASDPDLSLRQLAEAETLAKRLRNPDGTLGDHLRLARIYNSMGRSHFFRDELGEAMGCYQEALTIAQRLGDAKLLAIPSSVIGRVMVRQGRFGRASQLLAQAVEPLQQDADWPNWVLTVGYLGISLAARGYYKEGVAEGQRALACALKTKNLTSIGAAHLRNGWIYFIGGDMPQMLEAGKATVLVAKQSGDVMYERVGYGLQAWAESRLGNHDAAFANMRKIASIIPQSQGPLSLTDVFAVAQAEINLNAGLIDDAIGLAEKALTIAESVGSLSSLGQAHQVLGIALARTTAPRWPEVDKHLEKSLHALEDGEFRLEAARTHLVWGLIQRARHNPVVALEHLKKAANQFETSGLTRELGFAREAMSGLQ